MNQHEWMNDIASEDVSQPMSNITVENVVYTLRMSDFLKMPQLDYKELAKFDAHLRSLLN